MAFPNRHPNAAKPWTSEEVEALRSLAEAGTPLRQIANQLGRSQEAIRGRAAMHGIALGKNQAALKVEREAARREGANEQPAATTRADAFRERFRQAQAIAAQAARIRAAGGPPTEEETARLVTEFQAQGGQVTICPPSADDPLDAE